MGLRTFTFGGTSSSAYSMFITEAATYNVPERAVEMIEIPGRNGHYALDQGRFENVEVTYHVCVHKDTNANFQTELSDVRNWLASKVGYQRLTDDYNSNVYRMAIFKGGFETDETFVNGAEFDIVFECKPQRWLTSGETATAVANNGTLSNPTLFDASPLLAVKGYGGIRFNGYSVSIENAVLGDIQVVEPFYSSRGGFPIPKLYNANDEFTWTGAKATIVIGKGSNTDKFLSASVGTVDAGVNVYISSVGNDSVVATVEFPADTFTSGTTKSSTMTGRINYTYKIKGSSSTGSGTMAVNAYRKIEPTTGDYLDKYSGWCNHTANDSFAITSDFSFTMDAIRVNSTMSALGNPTYIDCDLGECYMYNGDDIVSLNHIITLGSDLPTLAPGTNTFTYDNTVTELKVTPRWWKV